MMCLYCQLSANSKRACCDHCWEALPQLNNPCSKSLYFDTSFAAFRYDTPIDFFITQLKFHDKLLYAHWLGKWFSQRCPLANPPEALLPVPLHKKRLRERGFNQALEITKPISRHFQLPILKHHVIRHKATKAQTELSLRQRAKNIKNAFTVKKPIPFEHIAIIDDVMTTGATVNTLSQCLKQSGVKQVDVWVIAKAC